MSGLSSKMTWREHANLIIDEAYAEIKQSKPELNNAEICREISKEHYPYGQRENHPYKIWLSAMKIFRQKLDGTYIKGQKIKKPEPKDEKQEVLFCK